MIERQITPDEFGSLFDEAVSGGCGALLYILDYWDGFSAWIEARTGREADHAAYRNALAVLDTFTPAAQELRRQP